MLFAIVCILHCAVGGRISHGAARLAIHRAGARFHPRRPSLRFSRVLSSVPTDDDRTRVVEDFEAEARNLFNYIDWDRDGQISSREMGNAFFKVKNGSLQKLWNKLKLETFDRCQEFIDEADIDGDGKVSFEEFRAVISQVDKEFRNRMPGANESEDIKASLDNETGAEPLLDDDSLFEMLYMFEKFDRDKDGKVTARELREGVRGSRPLRTAFALESSTDITTFVEDADETGDGTLSVEEFTGYLATQCVKEFRVYLNLLVPRKYIPRQKNAQVVIFREMNNQLQVLLQRRSATLVTMPLHLAMVGGRREKSDQDSRVTALREIAEETGLADIVSLKGSPEWLRNSVQEHEIPLPPRPNFFMFSQGPNCDWWVLRLNGPGVFVEGYCDGCEDITPLLDRLPDDVEKANCFGHAWFPVKSLSLIPDSIPTMAGKSFSYKIFHAAVALRRRQANRNVKASKMARSRSSRKMAYEKCG